MEIKFSAKHPFSAEIVNKSSHARVKLNKNEKALAIILAVFGTLFTLFGGIPLFYGTCYGLLRNKAKKLDINPLPPSITPPKPKQPTPKPPTPVDRPKPPKPPKPKQPTPKPPKPAKPNQPTPKPPKPPKPNQPLLIDQPKPSLPTESGLSPPPEETKEENRFFSLVESWAFLDYTLQGYIKSINEPEWQDAEAQKFLLSELQRLQNEIGQLQNEEFREFMDKMLEAKREKKNITASEFTQLNGLRKQYKQLKSDCANAIKEISKESSQIQGIENVGNSCYINSALQPLLAVKNFDRLIPEAIAQYPNESERDFEGRQKVFQSFKAFLKGWKEKRHPAELGALIGDLRREIFQSKLNAEYLLLGEKETSMQDTNDFLQLMFYVMGLRMDVTLKREGIEKTLDEVLIIQKETKPASCLQLNGEGTIQELINKACIDEQGSFERTEPKMSFEKTWEKTEIAGQPPALIIIQIWPPRSINLEEDGKADLSGLFKEKSKSENAQYELVGFAQNHHQVHWTSVFRTGSDWHYFDDGGGRENPQPVPTDEGRRDFQYPASCLVYQKAHSPSTELRLDTIHK